MHSEPWPLLAALDELLARKGWQEELHAVIAMERRIGIETNKLIVLLRAFDWINPIWIDREEFDEDDQPPPFLRSRDAAALLEEAVAGRLDRTICSNLDGWQIVLFKPGSRLIASVKLPLAIGEPAARTRAALEAGWRTGLWPCS